MTRAAALAVPFLALAACGGSTTPESLEDAAKETAESSSRMELSYRATDGSFRATMSGAFDYARARGVVTDFEVVEDDRRFRDESNPEEIRVLDGTDYLGYEVDGTTYWVREAAERDGDPFALLVPLPGGTNDPSEVFAMVLEASSTITNFGTEKVRGDDATHYRAAVDVDRLAENVPAAQRDEHLEDRDAEPLPVDVWVDGERRLRRISIREEVKEELAIITTFELFDFGVDVDVQPPPADQVITQERLDELTGEDSGGLSDEELEALCREEAPEDEADEICEEAGE